MTNLMAKNHIRLVNQMDVEIMAYLLLMLLFIVILILRSMQMQRTKVELLFDKYLSTYYVVEFSHSYTIMLSLMISM